MYFPFMALFALDEFKMALSQSEKLVRKRKEEAKHYKHIREDPERHNARNKSIVNSRQRLNKKKRKVKNQRRKLSKSSYSNEEPDTNGKESFKFATNSLAVSWPYDSASEF